MFTLCTAHIMCSKHALGVIMGVVKHTSARSISVPLKEHLTTALTPSDLATRPHLSIYGQEIV